MHSLIRITYHYNRYFYMYLNLVQSSYRRGTRYEDEIHAIPTLDLVIQPGFKFVQRHPIYYLVSVMVSNISIPSRVWWAASIIASISRIHGYESSAGMGCPSF